jgi:hypothetical protein
MLLAALIQSDATNTTALTLELAQSFMKSNRYIDPAMRETLASTGSRHHRYLTNEKGEREAIILPIDEYEELLEDIEDLAVVLERRGKPTIPFEEVKKRLKEDGLL